MSSDGTVVPSYEEGPFDKLIVTHVENGRSCLAASESILRFFTQKATEELNNDFELDRSIIGNVARSYLQRVFSDQQCHCIINQRDFYGLFVVCCILAIKYLCDWQMPIAQWLRTIGLLVDWSTTEKLKYSELERMVLSRYLNYSLAVPCLTH